MPQQTQVCCDKTFVMTKIILVAAPANDSTYSVVLGCFLTGPFSQKYTKQADSLNLSPDQSNSLFSIKELVTASINYIAAQSSGILPPPSPPQHHPSPPPHPLPFHQDTHKKENVGPPCYTTTATHVSTPQLHTK